MAGARREPRDRLLVPLAVLISGMWALTGVIAVLTASLAPFELTSGPFALMCGYVFGVKIVRNGNDQ